jgi:hypothetical protein
MQRTIARIRPLAAAFAAVVASVFVSLMVLQPPAERLLPGAAPADRGHVGALILPAPHVARPVPHRQQALAQAAPAETASFVPHPQAVQPATPSPVRHAPGPSKPVPKPKTKPTAPTPPTPTPTPPPTPPPPVAPPAPTPPTQLVALKRHGHGPPAHSNSHLLASRKQTGPVAPKGKSGQHGPPPGHGKPPPPPPATAPVQPAGPPATPPGQGGTPPGQGGTPPGQGGTPPGQGGTPPGHDKH